MQFSLSKVPIAMDATVSAKPEPIRRLLPYWAVLQADMQQTMRSWAYRVWVLVSILAAGGYLLYRVGLTQEAGIKQPASKLVNDLLQGTIFGSVTLIVVLTAGAISSERGTMADSVLSRGISRHQYFMGKWHSRLATILGTYFALGAVAMIASFILLHEDLSPGGSVMALLTVAALLGVVITLGVTVSAICNSTILGMAILWMVLYGGGVALTLLPYGVPSPKRALERLPYILQGYYDLQSLGQLIGAAASVSLITAVVGLAYFARRDV
jgi:ABC-type transport system involved in multi-copper enzyme maturation permease subunit